MNKEALLNKIVSDETTMTEIVKADSIDDVRNIFATNGVELTTDELNSFVSAIRLGMSPEEFDESELEHVSGGFFTAMAIFTSTIKICQKISKTCDKVGKWLYDQGV